MPTINKQGRMFYALIACPLFFLNFLLVSTPVHAGDRTNVPLKNWGGFSVYRSWVYDALEKLALAGFVDHALLNTKPLSRMEAARMVAQAVSKIKSETGNDYSDRTYLEDLVYQLVEEFGTELAAMGVKTPLNAEAQSKFCEFKPVDNIQLGSAYANNAQKLVNNSGQHTKEGFNSYLTLDGRNQVGDFLSLYYQPEFTNDENNNQGRLQLGYGKITFLNAELEVGRDSLWWGPGFRGSMLFSNNAAPLDQVKFGSAEPFRLPWVFDYIGPIKATTFVGQLESNRDYPNAYVGGYRLSLAPSRFLEIGHGRAYQFGGDGKDYGIKDFPGTVFQTTTSEGVDDRNGPRNINNLLSLDITVRIPNVDRYIFIARDMSIYGEMGWDDTRKGFIYPKDPGGLVGTYLTGFLGDPKLDFRLEYANSSPIMFTHGIYTSGFTYKDDVLSHFIGTDGDEFYARLSREFGKNVLLGLQGSVANIGRPQSSFAGYPTEDRYSIGPDFSYRFSERASIFAEYFYTYVENSEFISGKVDNDHLFLLEFTYSL